MMCGVTMGYFYNLVYRGYWMYVNKYYDDSYNKSDIVFGQGINAVLIFKHIIIAFFIYTNFYEGINIKYIYKYNIFKIYVNLIDNKIFLNN